MRKIVAARAPAQRPVSPGAFRSRARSLAECIRATPTLALLDHLEQQAATLTGASAKTRRVWQRLLAARREALTA